MNVTKAFIILAVLTFVSCNNVKRNQEPSSNPSLSIASQGGQQSSSAISPNETNSETIRSNYKSTLDSSIARLSVNILSTTDGLQGKGMYANRYPKNVDAKGGGKFFKQIAAYGAAYHIWIGPKEWTGEGASGVDGTLSVNLFPPNGSDSVGPHINYYEVPACVGCMLSAAALYFPDAMQNWNSQFNDDGSDSIRIPNGLKITTISSRLLTYTLPDRNGLAVRGVAYYDSTMESNLPFAQAEFTYSRQDSTLIEFLLQSFIFRETLN